MILAFHALLAISLVIAVIGVGTAAWISRDSWQDLVASRLRSSADPGGDTDITDASISSALSGGIAHVIGIFLGLIGLTGPGPRPGREVASLAIASLYVALQGTMLYFQLRALHRRRRLLRRGRPKRPSRGSATGNS